MTKSKFLSTVAATVLMTAGVAFAQAPAPSKDQAPTQPAPSAQQRAPAEKVGPSVNSTEGEKSKPTTTGQGSNKAEPEHGQSANKHEPDSGRNTQTGTHKGTSNAASEADRDKAGANNKADKDRAGVNNKTEMRGSADSQKSETNRNAERATPDRHNTTGQGSAAGSAKLSGDQRTKITTIIKEKKVEPVHLNVAVRVGTRIPEHVHYYPLPQEVVTIYPEWRGYDYILVGDQIVVIDPGTHEIVAVLEA